MTENDQKIQDAINSIRKRQSLSGLVKPNKQTQDAGIILEELIRLATFVQEVQPQLHFFNLFGQIVAKEREDFEDDEAYQERFDWLASMEIQAQQETQAQVQAAMEQQQAMQEAMQAQVVEVPAEVPQGKPVLSLV
jgi:hypothetical protein